MLRSRKSRPAGLETLTVCLGKAGRGRNSLLQNWDRLIFPKALEPVMALVAQKESKAQLRVPGLVMASPRQVMATAAEVARGCKPAVLRHSRLPPTPVAI